VSTDSAAITSLPRLKIGAATVAEFCRVLRPGGAAVVSTQHPVMD